MIDSSRLPGLLQSPRVRLFGAAALLLFLLVGVLGFLVVPSLVKSLLVEQASQALHRPVSVADIRFNPYALSLQIDGLAVQDVVPSEEAAVGQGTAGAEAPLFAFDRLYVNVSAASLFRAAPVIEELRLENPRVHLRRVQAQRYNVSDLIDAFLASPSSPTPAFSVSNIQISGGSIDFDDRVADEQHRISDIELKLPVISSMPQSVDSFVDPAFAARIDGAPFALSGRSKPFAESRESELDIDFKALDLTRYLDYLPASLAASVPARIKAALLDGDLKLAFRMPADAPPSVSLSGNATLSDVQLDAVGGEPLLRLERLELALAGFDPGQRRLDIDRIALTHPEVFAHARADGTLNWLALHPASPALHRPSAGSASPPPARPSAAVSSDPSKPSSPSAHAGSTSSVKAGASVAPPAKHEAEAPTQKPTAAAPFVWSLGEASVRDATLHWRDDTQARPLRADVDKLDLTLRGLTSQAGAAAEFSASARVDAGERLTVSALTLSEGRLDLAKRHISLGELKVDGAHALVRRNADGTIDFIAPPHLRQMAAARVDASSPRPNAPQKTQRHAAKPAGEATSPAWSVAVKLLQGDDINLRVEDQAVTPAATQVIERLTLAVDDFSTAPGAHAHVTAKFRINKKGAADIAGDVGLAPFDSRLQLDIKGVELLPLQPYFTERLNIAVTRGQLAVKGALQLHARAETAVPKKGAVASANPEGLAPAWSGGFTGQATVGDFFAVDKINAADFLRWKSLYFGGIDARLTPDSLTIDEIALSDFFARAIVSREGRLNLTQIVRPATPVGAPAAPAVSLVPASAALAGGASGTGKATAPEPTPPASATSSMPIRIGKVTLQGGNVNFTDNFVKPNYSANLRQIGGRISGLSSAPDSTATLDLRGSYDRITPLVIKARLNPLSKNPFLDLEAEVKGVEMTSFSPYSGKYAGYAIAKGKLSLFVKYRIENRQLSAENRVFLDQLTFGDRVDSPDATSLPVSLVVALLKNRAGEIDVNLPISGSLDDPQFSVGGLVVKVIVNLLVKAVTSPFALLGALFDGGEELAHIDFAPGRVALDATAQQRLDKLSKALLDRPALRLEITGSADRAHDREGLKAAQLDRAMRRFKREDLLKKGIASGASDEIAIAPGERESLLARVYQAAKFPKPRNFVGLVKSLPAGEMEKLILANTVIDDDDLRDLADRRAEQVREWLVEKSGAPSERVFLKPSAVADDAGKGDAGDKAKASGVDFSLR
ncbi:DUF748 domain-containing protein [Rhodocyclus tenuis]|uniref:DUF748 domain-containing protein n=1 Tax=Rhodocyclus gracilis TaxID=2929842 RepID=UPI001298D902|nr:DUF748 domain-containing protein [Rhodocyclus gracilis]MRD71777.1 DUF748 domain-containing protein [Rhodocyclus gracilis]